MWFSQMVENRTLRNFQMHWYDSTIEGYSPQTYEPGPGRMLPAPGDPSKAIMPVNIQGLDETMNAISFVTAIAERASGATAIEKGQGERKQQTLGEIKVLVGKTQERIITMTKAYRRSWKELAQKYQAILNANASKKMTLFKKGRDGRMWPKVIYPSDWKSESGYEAMIISTSEQEENDVKTLQKFQFALQQFPENMVLKKIAQKRMLESLDLSPDELMEIQEAQEQALQPEQIQQPGEAGLPPEGLEGGAPLGAIPSPFQAPAIQTF